MSKGTEMGREQDRRTSLQEARQQRQAAALRENLRRRKAQARGRAGAAETAAETPPQPARSDKKDA